MTLSEALDEINDAAETKREAAGTVAARATKAVALRVAIFELAATLEQLPTGVVIGPDGTTAVVTFPGGVQLQIREANSGSPAFVEYADVQASFEVAGASGLKPLGERSLAALLLTLQAARDNDTIRVLPGAHREERLTQLAQEAGLPLAELKFVFSQFENLNRAVGA